MGPGSRPRLLAEARERLLETYEVGGEPWKALKGYWKLGTQVQDESWGTPLAVLCAYRTIETAIKVDNPDIARTARRRAEYLVLTRTGNHDLRSLFHVFFKASLLEHRHDPMADHLSTAEEYLDEALRYDWRGRRAEITNPDLASR